MKERGTDSTKKNKKKKKQWDYFSHNAQVVSEVDRGGRSQSEKRYGQARRGPERPMGIEKVTVTPGLRGGNSGRH